MIIPAALGTLIIGLLYSLCTNWRFFKHRWITVKWAIMLFQIFFGALFVSPVIQVNLSIAKLEQGLALNNPAFLHNQLMLNIGGAIQVALFIFLSCISVLKPWKSKEYGGK